MNIFKKGCMCLKLGIFTNKCTYIKYIINYYIVLYNMPIASDIHK